MHVTGQTESMPATTYLLVLVVDVQRFYRTHYCRGLLYHRLLSLSTCGQMSLCLNGYCGLLGEYYLPTLR